MQRRTKPAGLVAGWPGFPGVVLLPAPVPVGALAVLLAAPEGDAGRLPDRAASICLSRGWPAALE